MPNTITMTSEYLPARRRGALVTLMFCGFTLGSAFGGIASAQLVPVMGWHGILVLGGVLPLMLFVVLLVTLPESPRWQVRRQLPQSVIAKTVSAITCERYADTHFYLNESATIAKGSIRQLFMGRQLPVTLMLWVVFFMSLLIIYLLSSWMPTLLNHRGIDLQHASWITAAFQIGGTLGALALGVLMDKFMTHVLKAKAVLCPGVEITFKDEINNTEQRWCYQDGLNDYLAEAVNGLPTLPEKPFIGNFNGETEAVDWALLWLPEGGERMPCSRNVFNGCACREATVLV